MESPADDTNVNANVRYATDRRRVQLRVYIVILRGGDSLLRNDIWKIQGGIILKYDILYSV